MATYVYKTKSAFSPNTLELTITETDEGGYTTFLFEGFYNLEEANAYATKWQDNWEFGYFGSAYAEETPKGPIVRARRRNSCD